MRSKLVMTKNMQHRKEHSWFLKSTCSRVTVVEQFLGIKNSILVLGFLFFTCWNAWLRCIWVSNAVKVFLFVYAGSFCYPPTGQILHGSYAANATTPVDSLADFRCDEGYSSESTSSLICISNFDGDAYWEGTPPECTGKLGF